jgi:glycosyltransferase involved in cell wall biosynthesis
VLSVGNINRSNLQRKGHEAFVRVARLLPSARFVLAGRWYDDAIERLRAIAPPNVSFPGWLTDDELNNLYARSSVYVQLSLHEGFGMSAAEAMLAGCIPVVTRVGSLPEVVGDVGRYVDLGDSERILAALREGLAQNDSERLAVRKRIVTNFSLKRRQAGLYQVVDGLLSAHD